MAEKFFERDWYSINETLFRIYSTNSIPLLQKVSLECLQVLIPCDQYVFLLSRTDNRKELCEPVILGAKAFYIREFLDGVYDADEDTELFFSGKHILSHNTETTRDSDLVPEDYLVTTKIYQEMYAKQNIHFALRSSLMARRKFLGTLEIFNSKERGDFSDKQLRIMTIVAPHIANHLGLLMDLESQDASLLSCSNNELKMRYNLTDREAEVVSLVSTGMGDSEIISALSVSGSTLKKHLYNAYRKIGVSSRMQLLKKLKEDSLGRSLPRTA